MGSEMCIRDRERLLELDPSAEDAREYLEELAHPEFAELVQRAHESLQAKQEILRRDFEIDEHERWDWDQETGQLVFSSKGEARIVADIQFVGSTSTVSGTWLWAWGNPRTLEQMTLDSLEVKDFGIERGFPKLAEAKWEADEQDGWDMTAVAALSLIHI